MRGQNSGILGASQGAAMPGGRPPKPTELLKIQGTFRKHRHANRPDGRPLGGTGVEIEPPSWLPPRLKAVWADIAARAPAGVLQAADREVFLCYVELVDRHQRAVLAQRALDRANKLPVLVKKPDGTADISPYVRIIDRAVLLMVRLQTELGFTPSARAKISVGTASDGESDGETGWNLLRRRFDVLEGGRADESAG
jgi:P27 family predicted phage terminase small subunit